MLALALLAAVAAPVSAPARPWTDAPAHERGGSPPAIAPLVRAALPAVVGIVATTTRSSDASADPFKDFLEKMYGPSEPRDGTPVRGIGTGFFIRADGLLVTNVHVIEGATDVAVQVGQDGRVLRGRVVGQDDATDLALVQVDGGPYPILPLGDSDAAEVGEWVVAIGNPFGLSQSVTTGIISYKGRRDVNPSGKPGYYDFIQTDAAINPGNSGGPLLDAKGGVIGINAAVNPTGQGIGFAIPIAQLKDIGQQLVARGRVTRAWMGLSIQEQLTPELVEAFAVPSGKGVLVTEVTDGGPAHKAGLQPGDIILAFNDEPVSEAYRLRWLTAQADPNRVVKLTVWRDRARRVVDVPLVEKPGSGAARLARNAGAGRPEHGPFGFTVEEGAESGLRVASVDVTGPGWHAGLREGDVLLEVDGRPVRDRGAFQRASATARGVARLYVRRGNRAMFVALRCVEGKTAQGE